MPGLERVPLLYLLVGLALVALALDVRLGYVRLKNNPLLPWALAHMAWCLLSMAVFARHALITQGMALSVAFILFTVLSQGAQTFRALTTVGVGMLALSLFVALVGFHQGFAELGCVRQDEVHEDLMIPIGAACKTTEQCRQEHEREDLFCEQVGLLGTTTVGGRVRFRGLMQDPNELALVSTLAVPFAFALFELRRTPFRLALAALTYLLVGAVDVHDPLAQRTDGVRRGDRGVPAAPAALAGPGAGGAGRRSPCCCWAAAAAARPRSRPSCAWATGRRPSRWPANRRCWGWAWPSSPTTSRRPPTAR